MEFLESDPNKAWRFRNVVIAKVSIVTLMKKYGLQLESRETGQEFTHRSYCPFHRGKGVDGKERTPSLFISDRTNSFFCFGCGANGTVIDFVSLIDGTPPLVALQKLAKDIGLIDKDGKWDELQLDVLEEMAPSFDPSKTIEPYLFSISKSMRSYITKFVGSDEFEKEFRWIERVGEKADGFLSNVGHEDWEYAKELSEKVIKGISKRSKSGE
jgi:DNA primase